MARKRPRLTAKHPSNTAAVKSENTTSHTGHHPTPSPFNHIEDAAATEPQHQVALHHRAIPKDVRLLAVPGSHSIAPLSFLTRGPGLPLTTPLSPIHPVGTAQTFISKTPHTIATTNTHHAPPLPDNPPVSMDTRERNETLARLNFSAADERRKALLERLRAIDKARNDLAATHHTAPTPVQSTSATSDKDSPIHAIVQSPEHPMRPVRAPVTEEATVDINPPTTSENNACLSKSAQDPLVDTSLPAPGRECFPVPASDDKELISQNFDPNALISPRRISAADMSATLASNGIGPCCKPMSSVHLNETAEAVGKAPAPLVFLPVEDGEQAVSHAPSPTPTSHSDRPRDVVVRRTSRSRLPSTLRRGVQGEGYSEAVRFSGVSKCKTLAFCKKLVNAMLRKPTTRPFSAPVQDLWPPEAIPRYFDVITQPMDLGTIKRRLEGVHYLSRIPQPSVASSPIPATPLSPFSDLTCPPSSLAFGFIFDFAAFCADVRLCFRNCMVYCPEHDVLFRCAKCLMEEFDADVVAAPRPVAIFSEASGKKPKRTEQVRNGIAKAPSRLEKKGPVVSVKPKSVPKKVGRVTKPVTKKSLPKKSRQKSKSDRAPMKKVTRKVSRKSAAKSLVEVDGSPSLKQSMDADNLKRRLEHLERCRVVMVFGDSEDAMSMMPMTFDEKTRLSTRISAIPPGQVPNLVSILSEAKGKCRGVSGMDEIEVDMDKLDCKILRKIEALVDSCVGPSVGGKPKAKKRMLEIDVSEFDSVEEIDQEIAAVSAQLDHVRAAEACARSGGLWEDSSSSDSGESSSSGSSDGDSSDESDPD